VSTLVRRACAIIDASDGETVSIAALCRDIDCHPATLTRAFRREQGCTPGGYQRRVRIGRAAGLLKATTLSVAEIAAACGFCDQAHLARSFRAVQGCSPSDYRRRA
jgi:AraC family transcriptional regulator